MKRLAIIIISMLLPISANALSLESPIDCAIGTDCFVQNYVDTDPGQGALDFRCGHLSYNGSNGTDIRLRNYIEMEQGVGIIAAADGKVIGVRDGLEDINIRDINPVKIKGKECGNAIVIDHGQGWKTQYCHLQKNTVYVNKGDKVLAGDRLGRVGLSGDTYYPHLTFIVRRDEDYIDPFTSKLVGEDCSTVKPQRPLWKDSVLNEMVNVETTLLDSGFANTKPDAELARYGKYDLEAFSATSNKIVLWVDIMGIQPNDILTLQIDDPNGNRIIEHQKNFIEAKSQQFYFTGKQAFVDKGWEPGIYVGTVKLLRSKNGKAKTVIRKTLEAYVR